MDTRDIREVQPDDCAAQSHLFAGIGGWPLALRWAGLEWLPCWTGSTPCQPFSVAGQKKGFEDERDLWPVWYRLIQECRPPIVFGEQSASRAGRTWFARLRHQMEAAGYRVAGANLCAGGVGAPHKRQRIYFGAVADGYRLPSAVADSDEPRPLIRSGKTQPDNAKIRTGCIPDWRADVVKCTDKKWRPIESGTSPLAYGVPSRVELIRGYGNAIVPQLGATFIRAFVKSIQGEE